MQGDDPFAYAERQLRENMMGGGIPLPAAFEPHNATGPLTSLLDLDVDVPPLSSPGEGNSSIVHAGTHSNLHASAATRDSNDISLGSRGGLRLDGSPTLEGECNLIVAGLTREVDDEALRAMFTPFGAVVSSTVMRHVGTGVSRGFGFVLFARQSDGETAVGAMHGSRCGPNTLNVHRSHHDGVIIETRAVFVRNLPLDVTVQRVTEFFAPIGDVQGVVIANDTGRDAGDAPNGKRYKVATVTFNDVEAARLAVRSLHNRPFPASSADDETPLVIVKFAESPDDRKKRNANRQRTGGRGGTPNGQSLSRSTGTASLHQSNASIPNYGVMPFVPAANLNMSGSTAYIMQPMQQQTMVVHPQQMYHFAAAGNQYPAFVAPQPQPQMFVQNAFQPQLQYQPHGGQMAQIVYVPGNNGQMVPMLLNASPSQGSQGYFSASLGDRPAM
jgi:RNA recognition motif-containing protein